MWFDVSMAFFTGIGIGIFYFGGLWVTVQKIPHSNQPFLLTFASFIIRLAISLIGFYLIIQGKLGVEVIYLLLSALGGFLLVRIILVQRIAMRRK